MSGFIRTIERAAKRKVYFNGRGSRLPISMPELESTAEEIWQETASAKVMAA